MAIHPREESAVSAGFGAIQPLGYTAYSCPLMDAIYEFLHRPKSSNQWLFGR